MLDAISGGSTIAITVGEMFALAGGAASLMVAVVGVYQSGLARDSRASARLDDLERFVSDEFKGGPQGRAGYKQQIESLRRDQMEERGATRERRRRHTDADAPVRRHTRGPGSDTQA